MPSMYWPVVVVVQPPDKNKVKYLIMVIYRGFSTVGKFKKFRLTDYELAKQDLMNHFSVRRGEKLMNPEFGTIIWNTLFEPLTAEIRQVITDDVKRIVSYDPRIVVDNVVVEEYQQGLMLGIDIRYVTSNQLEKLWLKFDRQQSRISSGA